MGSSFNFLQTTYSELYTLCELSEKLIEIDPNSSLTKSRLITEKIIQLIGEFEELNKTEALQAIKIDYSYIENLINSPIL